MSDARVDILIVGGGVGGCAAAMAAAATGRRVILTEETDWIGGQLTSQAVPPDEHRWIEQFGCTRRYRRYRDGVRQFMRTWYPLNGAAIRSPELNPGKGLVSRLCHEPRVGLAVLEAQLAAARTAGHLEVRLRRVPVSAVVNGDRVHSVTLLDTDSGQLETVEAAFILDATELGDLLPLTGTEYVSGAESQSETGEPHASSEANPENVQAITWCFPMAHDPDGNHVMDRPAQWERWRNGVPPLTPPWPGPYLSWTTGEPRTLAARTNVLMPEERGPGSLSLWLYRRIICRDIYAPDARIHEVTLVNWPQNDYLDVNIIDKSPEAVDAALEDARQLSLCLFYWMQTEAPRPDGGSGYPGLYLRPDLVGTEDGLAKYPYIRESRRIRAQFTVTETHVGVEARGKPDAETFSDSVGVGCYRIDLHPSTGGDNYIDISSLPFQIPLGALIPVRIRNLIPACKNIGATHITNGCYRLHPVEWNIGEAAGALGAFCLDHSCEPAQVRSEPALLNQFQTHLRAEGVELAWPRTSAV